MEELVKKIKKKTNKDGVFIESVLIKLNSLGFKIVDDDINLLAFCFKKAENYIKNFCNVSSVPDGLEFVFIDLICGEFLKELSNRSIGVTDEDKDNMDRIRSITEGDTSVTYELGKTKEERMKSLIDDLLNKNEELLCYRKIKWH